jgi:hypothetical protein
LVLGSLILHLPAFGDNSHDIGYFFTGLPVRILFPITTKPVTMKSVIIAGAFVLFLSCRKEKMKPVTELLSQKEWILTGFGFDNNSNGKLDAVENLIQDCQKDNSYRFHGSGIGTSLDNAVSCGGLAESQFSWRLLNNDTQIEIQSELINILWLDKYSMVLNPGLMPKLMMVYRH